MKETEIMIGDWVQSKIKVNDNHFPFIKIENGKMIDDFCRIFKPIPLTHEIIKSNGWELIEIGDNGIATPPKNRNRYEKYICKTKWVDVVVWYDRLIKRWKLHGMNEVTIQFVHDLQHALKMRYPNFKEIDL